MKKVILFLVSFIPLILQAQNYQNICSPGITFFTDSVNNLQAFRRDSASLLPNGDSLFLSYRAAHDTLPGLFQCADTTQGSILGRQIIKTADEWFFFFNRYNDTLKLKTQAVLNESWQFFQLTAGSYIQASVSSIQDEIVLGQPDQVKIITLQAKNSSNVNIPHPLNQRTIRLSQHYGLTQFFDVYWLPDNVFIFELAGKSALLLGVQDYGWQDIYSLNINDVFHYTGFAHDGSGSSNWKKIITVLGKTVFGNMDSVQYILEQCKSTSSGPPSTYTTSFDTVVVTYHFLTMNNTNGFLGLPMEFMPEAGNYANLFSARSGSFNDRVTKQIQPYWFLMDPGCWVPPLELTYDQLDYAPGLGCTHMSYGQMWWQWSESLNYFIKGSETWGTPVSTDCNTLVSVDPTLETDPLKVIISPNPVSQTALITIEGCKGIAELKFQVFDNLGRTVFLVKTNGPTFTFDRKNLPNGLYIYMVTGKELNLRGKLILE